MATSLGVLAVSNTSTYIQGGLDTYITDNGSSKTVDIYLYYRRTNSYSGTTWSSSVSATIKIGSQSATGTFAPSIPAYNNNWQGSYLHFSRTYTGSAQNVTISWSATDSATTYFGGSGSATITVPASYIQPTTPTVSTTVDSASAISVSYGTTSFGYPESGTVYLYGGTSSSPTSAITSKTSTGSSSYTYSGLSANRRYYFRSRVNNGSGWSDYSSEVSAITLPPAISSMSVNSQTYTAYNQETAVLNWTKPSDSGALSESIKYRFSSNNGSSWSAWTTTSISSTSGTITLTGVPTASTIKVQTYVVNANSNPSNSYTYTFSSLSTHTAPNFSNYTYADTNSATVALTGNDQTMIQGQSTPTITISTANKATGNDGIAVSNYTFSFSGRSATANWSSSSAVATTLGTPTTAGSQTMTVSAVDALSLTKAVSKSVTVYSWSAPTISASITRAGNFYASSTLKISGTWSPITISGTDKNTLTIAYRRKKSSGTTWDSWQTRPVTTSGSDWTTTDLVEDYDNDFQWDIQVRAVDSFTTTTQALTLSIGQPNFFIGSDGRVSIGGKPSKTKVSGKNGQLEVNGQIHIPNGSGTTTNSAIYVANGTASSDTYATFHRTDTDVSLSVGVGSSGTNHGIWSTKLSKWMIYADASDVYLANNTVKTASIKDANVTTAKIANSAVTSAKMSPTTSNVTITFKYGTTTTGTITAKKILLGNSLAILTFSGSTGFGDAGTGLRNIVGTIPSGTLSTLLGYSINSYYSGNSNAYQCYMGCSTTKIDNYVYKSNSDQQTRMITGIMIGTV